jgi:hypothetical protein
MKIHLMLYFKHYELHQILKLNSLSLLHPRNPSPRGNYMATKLSLHIRVFTAQKNKDSTYS